MLQGLETDAWSKQRDELGFTGKSTHFLPTSEQSVSSCPPEMSRTFKLSRNQMFSCCAEPVAGFPGELSLNRGPSAFERLPVGEL